MDGKCVSFCNIISIFHTNGFPYLTVAVFTEFADILCVFFTVKLDNIKLLCKAFQNILYRLVYKNAHSFDFLIKKKFKIVECVNVYRAFKTLRQYKACIIRVVCVHIKNIVHTAHTTYFDFSHLYALSQFMESCTDIAASHKRFTYKHSVCTKAAYLFHIRICFYTAL